MLIDAFAKFQDIGRDHEKLCRHVIETAILGHESAVMLSKPPFLDMRAPSCYRNRHSWT